jgi:hypothetical protein
MSHTPATPMLASKRRLLGLSGAFALGAASLVGNAPAALAADPTHTSATFSVPDTLCGYTGTSQWTIVDNFGSLPGGQTYDSGRLVQTFTAADGRGVTISWDGGHLVNQAVITNADGTTSLITTFDGLNAITKAVNGPVLEQGAGRVQVTLVFTPDNQIASVTAVSLAGNNPNLTGGPDCSVIAPYLAG